jgi:hypothetical protein
LALDHARKALAMIPRNTLGHANLARILLWRAEHERSQGRNPAADLEEGLKLTRAALAENAWLMTHHDLRGALLRVKAEAAMDRQQDPSGFLKEAESLLRRALTLDPRHQDHLAHWAQLQGTLARWRAQPKP